MNPVVFHHITEVDYNAPYTHMLTQTKGEGETDTSSGKEIPGIIESFPKAYKEEHQQNVSELFLNRTTLQGF